MVESGCEIELREQDAAPSGLSGPAVAAAAASALLGACGGADDADADSSSSPERLSVPSEVQAARFLSQCAMGITRAEIASVIALGYEGWLDMQFAMPQQQSRWDWMVAAGYDKVDFKNTQQGFDPAMWRKLIASPDTLRQRITLALSEILVVAIDGLPSIWKAFTAAAYFDLLETHAYGSFRNLIQQVSTSPAMGIFLTFRGSAKANPSKGSLPDENYARELMQLFTIGLLDLNADGTLKLDGGKPKETYGQADVSGLARVFTGWDWIRPADTDSPQPFLREPMSVVANKHESGSKTFLGTTIPAGTSGSASLTMALDSICTHPNVAPFIGRQLIQRLVTSNPSRGYVRRVSTVFQTSGGNLKAVIKAILLDGEARNREGLTHVNFGKLREPMLRYIGWARAFKATSDNELWAIGNTSDAGKLLGQSPGRSPSVFNFFRPGYVPPNSDIAKAGLEAPEFQITNESSVVGYVNSMQKAVRSTNPLRPAYDAVLPLVPDSKALLAELDLLLAAGQLSEATLSALQIALDSIKTTTSNGINNRLYAALVLVMAAPEYIVQK